MTAAPSFAPKLKVLGVEAFEQPFRLRLPFRFGVITLTEGVQAFLRVHVRLDDGREGFGYAAEMLAAKWFDKNPALSDAQNQDQLRKSIEVAAAAYREAPSSTAFDLYADNYRYQLRAGRELGLPPLVAGFGNALVDRGVLDAVCRLLGVSFWTAMRSNLPGMVAHPIIPDLGALRLQRLPRRPAAGAAASRRATPSAWSTRSRRPTSRPARASTTACPRRSTRSSRPTASAASSSRSAATAAPTSTGWCASPPCSTASPGRCTSPLDGNEQYEDVDGVLELWSAIEAEPALQQLCAATLFIEQPIKRAGRARRGASRRWRGKAGDHRRVGRRARRLRAARALGYMRRFVQGLQGLLQVDRSTSRAAGSGTRRTAARYFMSGEDLTTQAGLSRAAGPGPGRPARPRPCRAQRPPLRRRLRRPPHGESAAFLEAHPDLYHEADRRVRLTHRAAAGIALGSLECPGFGSAVVPDLSTTARDAEADWPPRER